MVLTEKNLEAFILTNLYVRMVELTQLDELLREFKSGKSKSMNLSLVLVVREEYQQPIELAGRQKISVGKKNFYIYKKLVRRISSQSASKVLSNKISGSGSTIIFSNDRTFDVALGQLTEESIHNEDWIGVEFIRNLKEKEYGIDWWFNYNL